MFSLSLSISCVCVCVHAHTHAHTRTSSGQRCGQQRPLAVAAFPLLRLLSRHALVQMQAAQRMHQTACLQPWSWSALLCHYCWHCSLLHRLCPEAAACGPACPCRPSCHQTCSPSLLTVQPLSACCLCCPGPQRSPGLTTTLRTLRCPRRPGQTLAAVARSAPPMPWRARRQSLAV